LEALIPTAEQTVEGPAEVPVASISPNPMQPRSTLDSNALSELAASIKEHGLIQPLGVTQQGPDR
jgi:ParB family chromosome partitioning protein